MIYGYRREKADVLAHWFEVVDDGFTYSSDEFYSEVERELAAREVPGLTLARVEFSEGGIAADRRVYLRMLRERLVFDVCAAPFGRAYFFSLRFAEIPPAIRVWQIAACLLALLLTASLALRLLGIVTGPLALAALFGGLAYVLRNAIALGLEDLDGALIKSPLFGPIYERCFRRESYYRHDTRLIYHVIVDQVVKRKVEEVTAAKGVRLVRAYEHSPILGDLYKPASVHL